MWNVKNLTPPPNFTHKDKTVDVITLKKACMAALSVLQNQKQLHTEAALLSRFIYSMKTKFRSDKGFNILEKVNRSQLQYLSLDLRGAYTNFSDCIPEPGDPDCYVPSRQMLQYLLVRTQGFARLWCHTVANCEDAAQYLRSRIGLGHSWWVATVGLAIIGRIWAIGRYLAKCACEWYSQLRPFIEVLNANGPQWLPEDSVLPDSLVDWLGKPWLKADVITKKSDKVLHKPDFVLNKIFTSSNVEDDDVEFVEEVENDCKLEYSDSNIYLQEQQASLIPSDDEEILLPHQIDQTSLTEDIGEYVSRQHLKAPEESLLKRSDSGSNDTNECELTIEMLERTEVMAANSVNEKQLIRRNNSSSHQPSKKLKQNTLMLSAGKQVRKLKTWQDLESFIEKEQMLREEHSEYSVTNKLDMLQWNMLKNVVNAYVRKLCKKSLTESDEKYILLMQKARKAIKMRII